MGEDHGGMWWRSSTSANPRVCLHSANAPSSAPLKLNSEWVFLATPALSPNQSDLGKAQVTSGFDRICRSL
jgi:hypothetical protein